MITNLITKIFVYSLILCRLTTVSKIINFWKKNHLSTKNSLGLLFCIEIIYDDFKNVHFQFSKNLNNKLRI